MMRREFEIVFVFIASAFFAFHDYQQADFLMLFLIYNKLKKEGVDMEWSYDRTHLNGTLTFRW